MPLDPRERSRLAARAIAIQKQLVFLCRHSTRFYETAGPVAAALNAELDGISRKLAAATGVPVKPYRSA